jgi:hypothetical protein
VTPQAAQSEQAAEVVERSPAEDLSELEVEFLKSEYDVLLELYTHTEDTLYSVFNFYLTLLSAIIGAIVVLFQLDIARTLSIFPTLAILLGFVVLLGIITQDAVVNKNADIAHYTYAMNALKTYLLRDSPDIRRRVFYQDNILTPVSPIRSSTSALERWQQRLWWMTPLGTHQLFVSLMNSLSLAVIAVVLVPGAFSLPLLNWRSLIVGPVAVVVFFIAQVIYAKRKFQRQLRRGQVTMSGETHRFEALLEVDA